MGVAISVFFFATPFIFYLYTLAPDDSKIWEIKLWGNTLFTIEAVNFWTNVQNLVYYSWSKLLLILSFSIWYFTEKSWWRYSLLMPIVFNLHQFASVINDNVQYYDHFEYIHSLPFTIPIIVIYIFFAIRLNNKKDSLNILEELDNLEKEVLSE